MTVLQNMRYTYLLFIFFLPNRSFAAAGLVTCQEAGSCTFCKLLEMINGIVEWLIIIAVLFSILVLAYAGFQLVTSGGDRAALERGKQLFYNAIIGILIILAGWTIVDTTIKLLVGGQLGMWNDVQCGVGEFSVGDATAYGVDLIDHPYIGVEEGVTPTLRADGQSGIDGGSLTLGDCDTSRFRTINFLGTSVQIHEALVPSLNRIDAAWRARGGSRFYRVDVAYGVQCRNVAGSNRRSNHAYGIAVDINPSRNPHMGVNGRPNTCVTDMPMEFVRLWTNEGWGWGCNWSSSKDAMHYSKAPGEGGNGSF